MNHNMSRIAYPVKWKILENFSKGIENGCEKVEKMKQTAQGQQELLQLTMQQAQDDKKLDPKTAQAIQNVYSVYA